ncbi:MAG: pyridoxamine 5'-phosphate oxidase [Phycisphaerales bacterium]|jgi:pyridoxamine 5'-phosphate oxidase|nr:pyridoxamine 5'-phosphate oxidase [Phycisphaerales bacterium]
MPDQPVTNFDQSDLPPSLVGAPTLPDPLPGDPVAVFRAWFDEAHQRRAQPNPNAFTLATIDPDGRPSARVVLCKKILPDPGAIVCFTNYAGRKGVALGANPRAAAVFHWDALDRQVRIEGPVTRSPAEESDEYFASRPWQSRVGAWASDQSRPIASRAALLDQVRTRMAELGLPPDLADGANPAIPRPPHWGGYRIWIERIELWLGGPGRVHDRAAWSRPMEPTGDGYRAGAWTATRLQP